MTDLDPDGTIEQEIASMSREEVRAYLIAEGIDPDARKEELRLNLENIRLRQQLTEQQALLQEAREALTQARLQIEYLHGKFTETGSGNGVLSQIDALLSRPQEAERDS